jgi:hypothetical protein
MLGHEPLQRDDIDRLGDILSDFRELGATAARTRGSARGKRCAGAADDRESCAAPREALNVGARLIAPSLAPVQATMLAPVLREIGSLPRAQGGRYPTVRSRARYVVRFGQRELCPAARVVAGSGSGIGAFYSRAETLCRQPEPSTWVTAGMAARFCWHTCIKTRRLQMRDVRFPRRWETHTHIAAHARSFSLSRDF